jgi:hypothetical protein
VTVQRITRFVFWLEGVVVSPNSAHQIQPGMAKVLDALHHRFELWLISNYPSRQVSAVISDNSLSQWFEDGAVYSLPEHIVGHPESLGSLVEAGVLIPGKSLLVDNHPIRTMLAVRQGIDASVFVDSERLYRDLVLWGIISLD